MINVQKERSLFQYWKIIRIKKGEVIVYSVKISRSFTWQESSVQGSTTSYPRYGPVDGLSFPLIPFFWKWDEQGLDSLEIVVLILIIKISSYFECERVNKDGL